MIIVYVVSGNKHLTVMYFQNDVWYIYVQYIQPNVTMLGSAKPPFLGGNILPEPMHSQYLGVDGWVIKTSPILYKIYTLAYLQICRTFPFFVLSTNDLTMSTKSICVVAITLHIPLQHLIFHHNYHAQIFSFFCILHAQIFSSAPVSYIK